MRICFLWLWCRSGAFTFAERNGLIGAGPEKCELSTAGQVKRLPGERVKCILAATSERTAGIRHDRRRA